MSLLDRIITLTLVKPVYGGSSLGFYNGKVVLVPFAVPGETVQVRIYEEKKDYCTGSIESCAFDSGGRIEPACVNFGSCGGCCYLHLPYQTELMIKLGILKDNLVRIAGFSEISLPEIELLHSNRFNYRSHTEVKVKNGLHGFYRKNSNELVPFPDQECLIVAPEINSHIKNKAPASVSYKLAIDADRRVIASYQENPVVTEYAGGIIFKRGIDRFFQANYFLRHAMMNRVISYSDIFPHETFLDIGCGVGFFTLLLAGRALRGAGVDISRENIHWAKQNARLNTIKNVEFSTMPAARIHPAMQYADIVIADPPRAGIDKKTRNTIITMNPRKIVYISCNPSTFSRDSKDFIRAGYIIKKITLADMFPCTHHIEVISLFERN